MGTYNNYATIPNSYCDPYHNSTVNNYMALQNFNDRFKLVENIDVVKMTEVPIGSYGIFPKIDFSEIYIKTWNSNGTTNIFTYQLADGQKINTPITLEQVDNKINVLTEKIDNLLTKKGISSNDY